MGIFASPVALVRVICLHDRRNSDVLFSRVFHNVFVRISVFHDPSCEMSGVVDIRHNELDFVAAAAGKRKILIAIEKKWKLKSIFYEKI